jgi:hypothetical protein
MLLVGAVGLLVVQASLVGGYLAASSQDPIVLDPNGGGLVEKRRRDGRVSDGAASRYRTSRLGFFVPQTGLPGADDGLCPVGHL